MTDRAFTTCLWFDTEGEEAADYYTSIFRDSRPGRAARYTEAGPGPAGSVMAVEFELNGQQFVALNGGPQFTFNEAISFQIPCADQDEVDYYWVACPAAPWRAAGVLHPAFTSHTPLLRTCGLSRRYGLTGRPLRSHKG
jgi:predicted 3-demethylubiquinone-9 3-methyltransferase (glyoxalase superfamily)